MPLLPGRPPLHPNTNDKQEDTWQGSFEWQQAWGKGMAWFRSQTQFACGFAKEGSRRHSMVADHPPDPARGAREQEDVCKTV